MQAVFSFVSACSLCYNRKTYSLPHRCFNIKKINGGSCFRTGLPRPDSNMVIRELRYENEYKYNRSIPHQAVFFQYFLQEIHESRIILIVQNLFYKNHSNTKNNINNFTDQLWMTSNILFSIKFLQNFRSFLLKKLFRFGDTE